MDQLRKGNLSDWWLDQLSKNMEKHFPEVIGMGTLVDHWKIDGWNDGTTTLIGVYKSGNAYYQCLFPDYGEPSRKEVRPVFKHTGWA